jgi:hypothetical protein
MEIAAMEIGQVYAVIFLDHSQGGTEPLSFEAIGKLRCQDSNSITLAGWTYSTDLPPIPDDNETTWTIVRSAILEVHAMIQGELISYETLLKQENSRRYRKKHEIEIKAKALAYRNANKEFIKFLRAHKSYGLTKEQFAQTQLIANCAICGRKFGKAKSALGRCIDHDHETGCVRGVICRGCNIGLGAFDDVITRLESAVEYLKQFHAGTKHFA